MVSPLAMALLLLAAVGPDAPASSDPAGAVGSALGHGSFPWYDAAKDEVKALKLPAEPVPPAPNPSGMPRIPLPGWNLGDIIAFVGFVVGIAALLALLAWFYRLYEPSARADLPVASRARRAQVEQLPAGLRREVESDDPWSEAIRRRDRGDLAGAIVCLFAHQLLTLSRLGLVRLAPGRTGRQLVRAVANADFRELVLSTLRQFEVAYYGHRSPTADDFAAAWAAAEAFERRVAEGVAA